MAGLYSHTTRVDGTTLDAIIYNGDHQNHIDNSIPAQQDDYSSTIAQMKANTDPGEVGSELQATTLAGELERIRFVIKEMRGANQWYESNQGAIVDGVTDDGPAYNVVIATRKLIEVALGSSAIGTTITPGANTAIIGNRATKLLGLDSIGNGTALVQPTGNDFSLIGPQITLPSGGANQLRGVRIRNVNDTLVALCRFNAERIGAWPILLDLNQDGVVLLGNIITAISNGIIWKPNLDDPTAETFQGELFIAIANLIRGFDGSSGRIGISIDGNCVGASIIGNAVENINGESGSAGFAYAVANDGAVSNNMSGIAFIGNIAKGIKDEAFHQEDQCNGVMYIGNSVIGAKRGIYVINTNRPRNILISHNFLRDITETGVFVAGTGDSRNITVAFNTIENWGAVGNEKPGILIGQSASVRIKVMGNILENGDGDAMEIQASIDVNVSHNTVVSCTGFALKISNPNPSVLVESNNMLSGAAAGPVDTGVSVDGLSGDQTLITPPVLFDGTTVKSHVIAHFKRAAFICRAEFIFEDANDSTSEQFVQLGFDGGTQILSNSLGTGDAQWSVQNLTFTSRLIPAGSVLTMNQNSSGDGSFIGRVRINYFEYD